MPSASSQENLHGIINTQLILLIAAFQKVRRATQHPLFSNDNGNDDDDGYPPPPLPPTSDYYLKKNPRLEH